LSLKTDEFAKTAPLNSLFGLAIGSKTGLMYAVARDITACTIRKEQQQAIELY
jgi:hypothetical protein